MQRIPGGPTQTLEETQRRLAKIIEHQEKHGFSLWALIHKETGNLIGDCGLILVEGRGPEIEISYDIAYKFWGRGYATEAARECLGVGSLRILIQTVARQILDVVERLNGVGRLRHQSLRESNGHRAVVGHELDGVLDGT